MASNAREFLLASAKFTFVLYSICYTIIPSASLLRVSMTGIYDGYLLWVSMTGISYGNLLWESLMGNVTFFENCNVCPVCRLLSLDTSLDTTVTWVF